MPSTTGFFKRRSLWISILLLAAALLVGVFTPYRFVSAKPNNDYARSATSLSTNKSKPSRKSSAKQTSQKTSTLLLQIIETEVFSNGTWHHPADGTAWTNPSTGAAMVHPLQYELHDKTDHDQDNGIHKQWQGEWKIAITGRSSRGWTYFYDHDPSTHSATSPLLQYTIRKRTWLRTIVVVVPEQSSSSRRKSPAIIASLSRSKKKQATRPRKNLLRSFVPSILADDWNFKGFGWTFYKSAVSPHSFGIGLRIPVTQNFASWETYQIPASIGWTISAFNNGKWPSVHFNTSVRMEWLIWLVDYTIYTFLPAIITSTVLLLLHGLLVALNAFCYPLFQKSIVYNEARQEWLWMTYRPTFRAADIRYRSDREERVGITWTWRYGDDWRPRNMIRWNVFHFYAWQLPFTVWNWITRRSAAFGWSVSGPVPNEPELLCSASLCFLLSGYYFRRTSGSSSADLSSSTSSATTAAAATIPPGDDKRFRTTDDSSSFHRYDDNNDVNVVTAAPSTAAAIAAKDLKEASTTRQVAGAL
jgi:hypothetical protein